MAGTWVPTFEGVMWLFFYGIAVDSCLTLFFLWWVLYSRSRKARDRIGRRLEKFCDLLGIQDNLREIFCVHLCHLFCIHQETPPMAFSGPSGSGKTVAGTLVRDLVNPVGPRNAAWAMPKGRKDLNDALSYSPVVLFDPVSRIGRSTGDALCAACDGGGFLRYDPKRAIPVPFGHVRILLAMQDDCAIRSPSLANRILRYEMRRPSSRWHPRNDIESEFGRMRPHLYHEIFGVLSRALGETDGGPADTRMADFEVTGRSIARAMGPRRGIRRAVP